MSTVTAAPKPLEVREDVQLFGPTAVAVLSFFFSAATGCLLLAYNWRKAGDKGTSNGYIAGAVIGLPIMIAVYSFLPTTVTLLINIGLLYLLRKQAEASHDQATAEGYYVSTMNAGVGVLIGLAVMVVILIISFLAAGALAS